MPNCPACVRSTLSDANIRARHYKQAEPSARHLHGCVNPRRGLKITCSVIPDSLRSKEETQSYVTFCSWLDLLMYRHQTLRTASCCRINHVAVMSQVEIANGVLHKQLPFSSGTTAMTDAILRDHTVLGVPLSRRRIGQ